MTDHGFRLTSGDRVLVVAPHPDDETLATGGLLQHAAAAGAGVRVLFVTDGENNPWPQRVLEHRWRIEASARRRWGARRRAEAVAALTALNVAPSRAVFLGLPDQGLTELLLTRPEQAIALVAAEIGGWDPTVVVAPSLRDRHPDHSALAVLTRLALAQLGSDPRRVLVVHYLVHLPRAFGRVEAVRDRPFHVRLSEDEKRRKRAAIRRHATQLLFHRRSFTRVAERTERFLPLGDPVALDPTHPIRYAAVRGHTVALELASPRMSHLLGSTVVVLTVAATPRTAPDALPWAIESRGDGDRTRSSGIRVAAFRAPLRFNRDVVVPVGREQELAGVFVKLERRPLTFFDDGWREIPLPAPERATAIVRAPSASADRRTHSVCAGRAPHTTADAGTPTRQTADAHGALAVERTDPFRRGTGRPCRAC